MSDFCSPAEVIAPVGLSDHHSVLFTLQKAHIHNQYAKISIRRGKASARHAFGEWLNRVNWANMYRLASCESKLNMLQNVVTTGLDCLWPKRTVKLHNNDKPWITPGYKDLIAKRQMAFHQGDRLLYCKLRNRVVREGKRLRSTFLNTKLAELKSSKTTGNGGTLLNS